MPSPPSVASARREGSSPPADGSGSRRRTPLSVDRLTGPASRVMADDQVHAAGGFVEVPDGESTTLLPSTPVDFGSTPWAPRAMAPEHGEHSEEILMELGRSAADIDALKASGIVS